MLFVRAHGPLHAELLATKQRLAYLNTGAKSARFAEFSLKHCRNPKAASVGKAFADAFIKHDCYFRSLAFDWSQWHGKYFGKPFDADALKKRRAYKKWCELLIHGETQNLNHSDLYLDELRIVRQYDVLNELQLRFTKNYKGDTPWIRKFVHAKSWQDEHQCLQLCDLLTGAVYRALAGADGHAKEVVTHLETTLLQFPSPKPIKLGHESYWRGFHKSTLTQHFPKFSQWIWTPSD